MSARVIGRPAHVRAGQRGPGRRGLSDGGPGWPWPAGPARRSAPRPTRPSGAGPSASARSFAMAGQGLEVCGAAPPSTEPCDTATRLPDGNEPRSHRMMSPRCSPSDMNSKIARSKTATGSQKSMRPRSSASARIACGWRRSYLVRAVLLVPCSRSSACASRLRQDPDATVAN
jgi:hypothetical protein